MIDLCLITHRRHYLKALNALHLHVREILYMHTLKYIPKVWDKTYGVDAYV